MTKVFIDGSVGTTGLQIHDRLRQRDDIKILEIPEELRKDINARKNFFNEADIVFLCLPDQAAIEAVELVENNNTVVIDTSTAHRVSDNWAYGMPELKGKREIIKNSKRIANPGCHASGVIALVAPLVENKILSPDSMLSCFSLTGYSGGGKKMIAEYQAQGRNILLDAPRQYALSQSHKHLPEIQKFCSLNHAPIFCPIVADFYSGMEVTVCVNEIVNLKAVREVYKDYYRNGLIHFVDVVDGNEEKNENGFLSAGAFSGRDDMEIRIAGNDERVLLIARFDNLGKGASGAAVQNMNLVMGIDEYTGLNI